MRRALAAVAGIAVSVVFGWLAIRGLNFHEVRSAIGDASPAWILAAVGVSVVGVAMRSERWRSLFPRDVRPRPVPTFWASQVGLLANNVLPVRAGELVRVLALSPRVGPAAHGGTGDGRRGARLRPGRDRAARSWPSPRSCRTRT